MCVKCQSARTSGRLWWDETKKRKGGGGDEEGCLLGWVGFFEGWGCLEFACGVVGIALVVRDGTDGLRGVGVLGSISVE